MSKGDCANRIAEFEKENRLEKSRSRVTTVGNLVIKLCSFLLTRNKKKCICGGISRALNLTGVVETYTHHTDARLLKPTLVGTNLLVASYFNLS